MRLIDADALGNDIGQFITENAYINMSALDMALMICRWVGDAPTIEAEPVRHGRWILRHVGAGHYWECGCCHKNPCIYVTKDTKFCPNCGAKNE